MELPFTIEQFLGVFRDYNTAIWPAQVLAYVVGGVAVYLSFRRTPGTNRAIGLILGVMWLWMGAGYHIAFFSEINPAAYIFGGLFIIQGIAFLVVARGHGRLRFSFRSDAYGVVGAALILYAVVLYPVIGYALGHGYPQAPMFGVAPCPTAIFTFGILLWTDGYVSRWLLAIPLVWSLIGFSAAINLGIREDIGLLVAGVACVALLEWRRYNGGKPRLA